MRITCAVFLLGWAVTLVPQTRAAELQTAQHSPDTAPGQSGDPQASAGGLEEITVTARRVEERLLDVPVAVTAFRAEDLQRKEIVTGADLMFNVPSLSVAPVAAGNAPNYGLRAQRQGIGNATGVVTYLAEVPVDGITTYQQTYDMGSIQVLKGPQGTLFGANANGGAILFVPQKPTNKLEGNIEVDGGSYNLKEATGMINLPVLDWLQIRGAARVDRREGYTENLNPCPVDLFTRTCGSGGAQDDERYESWRISVAARPTTWLSDDLVYFNTNDHSVGNSWIPFRYGNAFVQLLFSNPIAGLINAPTAAAALAAQQQMGVRKVYSDEDTQTNKTFGLSNITTAEVGDITLKNIFGYRGSEQGFNKDQDGSILPLVWQSEVPDGYTKTTSDELQVLGSAFGRLHYVTGGYLSRQNSPGNLTYAWLSYLAAAQYQTLAGLGINFLPQGPVTGTEPAAPVRDKTNALYGNITLDLSDAVPGLSVSGGYRYTWDKSTQTAPNNLVNGVCTLLPSAVSSIDQASCSRITVTESNGYNYSFTPQYKISDRAMVYVSTRHGFKPGGPNDPTVEDPNYFTYKPETITDYEFGIKSEFDLGEVASAANVAIYTSTYKDIQRSEVIEQPDLSSTIVTFNAQKATIRGLEPELQFRLTQRLDFGVFYSYLDAHFDKYQVPGPDGTTIDKTANAFSAVSKNTVGANILYRLPLPAAYGDMSLAANYYYRSRQTFADNTVGQPADLFVGGYSLTNLRAEWTVPGMPLKVAVAVTNLFDKEYAVGGADYTGSVVGVALTNYGPPRMARVELSSHFD
jgi:iron complex outermembrane receptor protein